MSSTALGSFFERELLFPTFPNFPGEKTLAESLCANFGNGLSTVRKIGSTPPVVTLEHLVRDGSTPHTGIDSEAPTTCTDVRYSLWACLIPVASTPGNLVSPRTPQHKFSAAAWLEVELYLVQPRQSLICSFLESPFEEDQDYTRRSSCGSMKLGGAHVRDVEPIRRRSCTYLRSR